MFTVTTVVKQGDAFTKKHRNKVNMDLVKKARLYILPSCCGTTHYPYIFMARNSSCFRNGGFNATTNESKTYGYLFRYIFRQNECGYCKRRNSTPCIFYSQMIGSSANYNRT